MAVQAPAHAQRGKPGNGFHGIDPAVTRDAPDASGNVGSMMKIGVIGKIVDAYPRNRVATLVTCPKRLERLVVLLDLTVAIHTGLSRWDGRPGGKFHRVVAIPAVDPKGSRMKSMAERYRLFRSIARIGGDRAESPGNEHDSIDGQQATKYDHRREKQIAPFREDVMIRLGPGTPNVFHKVVVLSQSPELNRS